MKPKKCKSCRMSFTPSRPLQSVCSPQCAATHAKTLRERIDKAEARIARLERKAAKEKAKDRSDWLKSAERACNAFIRARDKDKPCISCGRFTEFKDAGHYRNKSTHPELRFNEENIHGQCRKCNSFEHGNLLEYRIGLIQRVGLERVEWLESNHPPAKHSIQDLQVIESGYRAKLKELGR